MSTQQIKTSFTDCQVNNIGLETAGSRRSSVAESSNAANFQTIKKKQSMEFEQQMNEGLENYINQSIDVKKSSNQLVLHEKIDQNLEQQILDLKCQKEDILEILEFKNIELEDYKRKLQTSLTTQNSCQEENLRLQEQNSQLMYQLNQFQTANKQYKQQIVNNFLKQQSDEQQMKQEQIMHKILNICNQSSLEQNHTKYQLMSLINQIKLSEDLSKNSNMNEYDLTDLQKFSDRLYQLENKIEQVCYSYKSFMAYFNNDEIEIEIEDKWFKRLGKLKQHINKQKKALTLKEKDNQRNNEIPKLQLKLYSLKKLTSSSTEYKS